MSTSLKHFKLVLPRRSPPSLKAAAAFLRQAASAETPRRAARAGKPEIHVRAGGRAPRAIGREGFVIRTESANRIVVTGATGDGAANGLFAMARRLRAERQTDPFALPWDVQDAPWFEERGIWLLDFLAGYTHLSVDGFTVKDWRAYIDFLRSLGGNMIGVLSVKLYNPNMPETYAYRLFSENVRAAIRYAHKMGMRFQFAMPHNTVPPEVWWKNPDLRAKTWGYQGLNLCPHKGRGKIREAQRPFLEFLREIDVLAYMFVDGGADCHCDYCRSHEVEVIVDSLHMARELLAQVGSKAKVSAFTWALDRRPGRILERVIAAAPDDVLFIDSSFEHPLIRSGRTGYGVARQAGRRASNFLFLTDPEGGMETQLSVFPYPRIAETWEEIDRSRRHKADGIVGYRLTPPTRFLSDNLVLRLAWNPQADAQRVVKDIVKESVALPAQRASLTKAIRLLEKFHATLDVEVLRDADRLFAEVCRHEVPLGIRYAAEGVHVLLAVAELAFRNAKPPAMKEALLLFGRLADYEIYQGYTTDQGWIGRSCRLIILPLLGEWMETMRLRARHLRSKKTRKVKSKG